MKEITYEDWQKNPTPRMMWVWNATVEDKVQAKVISVVKADACIYPVLSIMKDDVGYDTFQHCAEIKKQKRMTNKELSRWLREKPTREFKYSSSISCSVHSTYTYNEDDGEEEVSKDVVIREDDGEWREPLMEVEEWLDKRCLKDMGVRKPCKEAFLAGFKAGKDMTEADLATIAYMQGVERCKTKWHKVADGDLPKENKLYLVQIKDNGLAIAYFNGRYWETRYNLGESGHCVETVIAWREIPTFEE